MPDGHTVGENAGGYEQRLASLEAKIASLAIINLDLLLVLEILVRERRLDGAINVGDNKLTRPSKELDRLWKESHRLLPDL